jgi:cytochrome P450/NADPH-cytochrome P450 reductase
MPIIFLTHRRSPAVLRETLRLAPPAAARVVAPIEDTTLGGGKYSVKAGDNIVCQIYIMHRDTAVWGEDVCLLISQRFIYRHLTRVSR